MDHYKQIGIQLKQYFNEMGLTQLDIAKQLGVSQQSVGAYLNGQPFGKKTAEKWSKLFGIQYSWLLTGEGNMLKNEDDENLPINLNFTDMELRTLLHAIEQHGETLRMNQEELGRQGKRLDQMLEIISPLKQSRIG